jgi:hypothetical protein
MDAIVIWRMWHIDTDGHCSCGEPVSECFYWLLVYTANEAMYEQLFSAQEGN